jgi:hypothetical protein
MEMAGGDGTMSELYLNPNQSRSVEPTPLENAIGDVIERCFADGVTTCEPIVEALNTNNVPAPDSKAWTVASFQSEMKRLGA